MKIDLLPYCLLVTAVLSACQSKPTQTAEAKTPPDVTTPQPATGISTDQPEGTSADFLIIPGKRVGPIQASTSEADLLRLLGASVVTAGDTLYGAEGAEFVGTTLYKGTPDEVQIMYADSDKRTQPQTVLISPTRLDDEGNPIPNLAPTRWTTADGLHIGTTLKELEKRNGKPFKVWGFEWDYGGQVSNWQGGNLNLPGKKALLALTLGPPISPTPSQQKAYDRLMGDSEYLSSGTAMQLLNPSVQRMQVSLEH